MSDIYSPKSKDQLVDAMIAYLVAQGSSLTNFNVGSRNRTLLEAIASVSATSMRDMYLGLKRAIPVAAIEGLNFTRKPGIAATGQLEFTRLTSAPKTYPIPIGTRATIDGVSYETTVVGEITISTTSSGNIASQCTQVGTIGNLATTTIDTQNGVGSIIGRPEGIEFAENTTAFAGGEDEETDEKREARFQDFVKALHKSGPHGLITGALTVTVGNESVAAASVVEGLPTVGWNTVYCDDGTGNLSAPLKAEVEKVLNGDTSDPANYPGYRAAGIQLQVLAPSIVSQDFDVQIYYLETFNGTLSDLEATAQTGLEQYVNALRLGQDYISSMGKKRVHDSHKDIYKVEITTPSADVSVSPSQIVRTGTVTVNSFVREP